MRVQVDVGAKKTYTYEVPEGTAVGDQVMVPPPPWAWPPHPQSGTVTEIGSDYQGEVKRVLTGWTLAPSGLDWDMSDWGPEDLVVEGIVMALEGCGANEDPAAVITSGGRELRVLGVRRGEGRVEIVVEG